MVLSGFKLRFRTALFIAGAFSLLLTAYFAVSYLTIKSSLTDRSDTEVYAALDSLISGLPADAKPSDLSKLAARFGITGEASIGFKVISQGQLGSAIGPPIIRTVLDSHHFVLRQLPMDFHVGVSTIRVFGRTIGERSALAAINTIAFEEVYEAMLRTYFLLLLSGILVSFVIAIITADLALKPLKLLVQSAVAIKESKSSTALPTQTKTREINELAIVINDILSERDRNIDRLRSFTADAAHELRTPLTILRGELEVDLRTKQLSADEREALESNLEEVRRLIRIVEDLMLLARAEQPTEKIEQSSWKLSELVGEIVDRLEPLATSKQITISNLVTTDRDYSFSRPDTERIVYNIILNAIQYTPNGKTIHLSSLEQGGDILLSVRDEGIGIAESDIPQIFDRFWRADTSRSRSSGGVGLGLSIAKTFADRLGISIECTSNLGIGTTMTCRFPTS